MVEARALADRGAKPCGTRRLRRSTPQSRPTELAETKVNAAAGAPEALKTAQAAAAGQIEALATAQRAARIAREDREVAEKALALAEAKQSALKAVLYVEWLEDQRAPSRSGSEAWAAAARLALAAQRRLAEVDASLKRPFRLEGPRPCPPDPRRPAGRRPGQKGDPLKDARAKAAAAVVEARGRFAAAEQAAAHRPRRPRRHR